MLALGGALTVFLAGVGIWLVSRWLGDMLSPVDGTAGQRVPFAGGEPMAVHAWSRYHAKREYFSPTKLSRVQMAKQRVPGDTTDQDLTEASRVQYSA